MVRTVKTLLIATVALWGFVGAFENIENWGETLESVRAVTSMETMDGGADRWQASSNFILVWSGALFIMLSKLAAGLLCSVGAYRMWKARASDAVSFSSAKRAALAGCAIAVLMLFGGFIVIAESFFELWRSETLSSVLATAFRYAGLIALIAIFVNMSDD